MCDIEQNSVSCGGVKGGLGTEISIINAFKEGPNSDLPQCPGTAVLRIVNDSASDLCEISDNIDGNSNRLRGKVNLLQSSPNLKALRKWAACS